jgi:hypothetical protein
MCIATKIFEQEEIRKGLQEKAKIILIAYKKRGYDKKILSQIERNYQEIRAVNLEIARLERSQTCKNNSMIQA